MADPLLAKRSCDLCQLYDFNEKTGLIETDPETDEPIKRPDPSFAPCRMHEAKKRATGCPKGTPEKPKGLNERNQKTYNYIKEQLETGGVPDDGLVKQAAATIRDIEETYNRLQLQSTQRWLQAALAMNH